MLIQHPTKTSQPKVAIVSDYPKKNTAIPLADSFYFSVKKMLENNNYSIQSCLVTSICSQYPGYDPKPSAFDYNKSSAHEVANALVEYQPDVVLLLGNLSLSFFKHDSSGINEERGSPFKAAVNGVRLLFLPTYHPRRIFMQFQLSTIAEADVGKALRLGQDGWEQPHYYIESMPSFDRCLEMLQKFEEKRPYLSVDIETQGMHATCIGFAYNRTSAIVIPLMRQGAVRYWSEEQEQMLWPRLAKVLETCPLVGQNCLHFDKHVLERTYGIQANFIDDTMFATWECYPDFPKSLSFLSSIHTDNPYWKGDLKLARQNKIPWWKEYEYNGRDCIITLQIAFVTIPEIKEMGDSSYKHYRFNIRAAKAYNYMATHGAKINQELLQNRIAELETHAEAQQEQLDNEVGRHLNVRSPKQMKYFLYEENKLPKKTKLVKTETGEKEERLTSDHLTILYLAREHPHIGALTIAGNLRRTLKRISSLRSVNWDDKGFAHWNFNVVGTETGRSSGYKPIDGKGVQPQNVDRRDRDLFQAPEGYYWCKADLEGADSVTVGACLEVIGEPRLHEDIREGIKPAQTLALAMMYGDEAMQWSASHIKTYAKELKSTNKGARYYLIAKRVNHGAAYMLQGKGMHTNIFKDSDGDIYISPDECENLKSLLFKRYNYKAYHDTIQSIMLSSATLSAASGQTRIFFGRKDNATLREMLAYLPQAHTAYVTNQAIVDLYETPKNRDEQGHLIIKPINQVHDETDLLLPCDQLETCSKIFQSCSDVPLEIWGQPFNILFEANYGNDWSDCETSLV